MESASDKSVTLLAENEDDLSEPLHFAKRAQQASSSAATAAAASSTTTAAAAATTTTCQLEQQYQL